MALGLPGLQAPLQPLGAAGLQQPGIRAGAEQRLIPLLGGPRQQAGLGGTTALGELHGCREEGISAGDPLEAVAAALQLVHRQGLQRQAGEQQQGGAAEGQRQHKATATGRASSTKSSGQRHGSGERQCFRAFPGGSSTLRAMAAPLNDQPDRLLIVDDDPELLKLLIDTLQQAGHQCTPAADGQQALLHLRQREFELVLLDWTLPDLEGVEVLRRMRRTALNTPVLMLTARDSLEERIAALDAGADDYLTKPFELQELNARVRAQLRRRRYEADARRPADLTLGDLSIDLFSRSVCRGDREVNLSQREFELLCFLVQEPECVHSRQAILEGVWGSPFVGDPNTLDVYMGYLRRKIEEPGQPQLLHTVRGVGFMARNGDANV